MIKLMELLQEYTEQEKKQLGIPPGAVSWGGRWYNKNLYVGRVVNGKFVSATKQDVPQPTPPTQKIDAPKQPSTIGGSSEPVKPKKILDKSRTPNEIWPEDKFGRAHKFKDSNGFIYRFDNRETAEYFKDQTQPDPENFRKNTPINFEEQLKKLPTADNFTGATNLGVIRYTSPVVNQFFSSLTKDKFAIQDAMEVLSAKLAKKLKQNSEMTELISGWKNQDNIDSVQKAKLIVESNEKITEYINSTKQRVPVSELARGMRFTEPSVAAKFLNQLEVGNSIELPLSSFSYDVDIACTRFGQITETDAPGHPPTDVVSVIMKVTNPNSKGIRGCIVPPIMDDEDDYDPYDSEISDESEILLPNAKYKVVSVQVGQKDKFVSAYPASKDYVPKFKTGVQRPFYMIHLEQIDDEIVESTTIKHDKNKYLNLIYMSTPMNKAPSNLVNYFQQK